MVDVVVLGGNVALPYDSIVAAGGQPMTFLVVAHAVPSLLCALTGRTSASFLGRLALVTATPRSWPLCWRNRARSPMRW